MHVHKHHLTNHKIMRTYKQLLLTIILSILFFFCKASGVVFEQGSSVLSFGIGFGDYPGKKGTMETTFFPNIMAAYEYGIADEIGIGFFSLGAHVGFAAANGNEPILSAAHDKYEYNATFVYAAPRINYHLNLWKITKEPVFQKTDLYLGGTFGIGYKSIKYKEDPSPEDKTETHTSPNLILGGRFYFNKNAAINLEVLGGADNCVYLGIGLKF